MKTALKGRLAQTPELKEVEKDGKTFLVTEASLYVKDPARMGEGKKDMAFDIVAYNDNAKALCDMQKGDILTGAFRMKTREFTTKDGRDVVATSWALEKIDPRNKLADELTAEVTDFVKGEIEGLNGGKSYEPKPELEAKSPDIPKAAEKQADRDADI